jgi:ABC-2 type transport system ATP-binding protein
MNAVLESNVKHLPVREPETDHALQIEHVSKHFGGNRGLITRRATPSKRVNAVDDVSMTISPGEIYGVLGANGSGKSTLIRLIATLLYPDEGSISVFGHDVMREALAVQRMLNRVSVEASLFKKLSAMENLMYAARLYSVDARWARKEITRILEALGIQRSRIGQPVEKMSRGMQQKVAIARALLTSPVLLLLDEPTTGLDPRSKKDVQRFVRELRETHNATILLTSHDMEEADTMCDRIAILDKGKVIVEGTSLELKQDYRQRHEPSVEPSLEDIFMEITGRSLAEDQENEEGGDG